MNQRYHGGYHAVSAGSLLAQAREDAELTVEDVAQHLKLSPAQVEALESGAFERLPGRVFVRGFLRNYAKLLGVDPQPLLRSIEHEIPQSAPIHKSATSAEVVMPRGEGAGWPLYAGIVAVVIVGALAVYEFGFNDAPRDSTSVGTSGGGQNAKEGTPFAQAPTTPATGASTSRPLPDASAATGRSRLDSTSSGLALAPLPANAVHPGERELHFRFENEAWVEIRDRNDKIIFSKLNRAGSEERVAAVPPLKLVVGNARGVRLNYGGQAVDLAPHIGVTVARLTLQ